MATTVRLPDPPRLPPGATRQQTRTHFRDYSQLIIWPTIRAWEMRRWINMLKNVQYWRIYHKEAWTVKELAEYVDSPFALQAWAQLKLQRFFTQDDNCAVARQSCAACGQDVAESAEHLLEDCPKTRAKRDPVFARLAASCHLPAPGPSRTSYVLGFASSAVAAVECVNLVARIKVLVLRGNGGGVGSCVRDSESDSSCDKKKHIFTLKSEDAAASSPRLSPTKQSRMLSPPEDWCR